MSNCPLKSSRGFFTYPYNPVDFGTIAFASDLQPIVGIGDLGTKEGGRTEQSKLLSEIGLLFSDSGRVEFGGKGTDLNVKSLGQSQAQSRKGSCSTRGVVDTGG